MDNKTRFSVPFEIYTPSACNSSKKNCILIMKTAQNWSTSTNLIDCDKSSTCRGTNFFESVGSGLCADSVVIIGR